MDISAERRPAPPQRLTKVHMMLHLTANDLPPEKVERAIRLSEEKYCSVHHSLREDIEIVTGFTISPVLPGEDPPGDAQARK